MMSGQELTSKQNRGSKRSFKDCSLAEDNYESLHKKGMMLPDKGPKPPKPPKTITNDGQADGNGRNGEGPQIEQGTNPAPPVGRRPEKGGKKGGEEGKGGPKDKDAPEGPTTPHDPTPSLPPSPLRGPEIPQSPKGDDPRRPNGHDKEQQGPDDINAQNNGGPEKPQSPTQDEPRREDEDDGEQQGPKETGPQETGVSGPSKGKDRATDLPAAEIDPNRTWTDEYREGLRRCRARAPAVGKYLVLQPHTRELHDDHVFCAIGSLWRGLYSRVQYQFSDTSSIALAKAQGNEAVVPEMSTEDDFIIPLLIGQEEPAQLSPEEETNVQPVPSSSSLFGARLEKRREDKKKRDAANALRQAKEGPKAASEDVIPAPPASPQTQKEDVSNAVHQYRPPSPPKPRGDWVGGLGHTLFAIAQRTGEPSQVDLLFFDSLPRLNQRSVYRRAVRDIVRNTGFGGPEWPTFRREIWIHTPVQSRHQSSCGIHTVLNAWAAMLGFRTSPTMDYRRHNDFYEEALNLLQLSLQGLADTRTIIAFLQHSGFCLPRSLHSWLGEIRAGGWASRVDGVQSFWMSDTRLTGELAMLRESYEAEGPPPTAANPPINPFLGAIRDSDTRTAAEGKQISPPFSFNDDEQSRRGIRQLLRNQSRHRVTLSSFLDTEGEVKDVFQISHMQVIRAIAALWSSLQNVPPTKFSIAAQIPPDTTVRSFGRSEDMIMPIFLPRNTTDSPNKAEGHHVLCVVQHSLVPKESRIHIFNSSPDVVEEETITRDATERALGSGWQGLDGRGGARRLPKKVAVQVIQRHPPSQLEPGLSGFHTILNAWAYMLDLEMRPGQLGLTEDSSREFLEHGVALINRALQGGLDAGTIRIFLQAYGYVEFKGSERDARKIYTASMSDEELGRMAKRFRYRDILYWNRMRNVPDADQAQQLRDIAASKGRTVKGRKAEEALIIEEGHPYCAGNTLWERAEVSDTFEEDDESAVYEKNAYGWENKLESWVKTDIASKKEDHHIRDMADLDHSHILLLTFTLAEALRRYARDGGSREPGPVIGFTTDNSPDPRVYGRGHRLLMPLQYARRNVGESSSRGRYHYVLAAAECSQDYSSYSVTFHDTSPGVISQERLRSDVRRVVSLFPYLGYDERGMRARPYYQPLYMDGETPPQIAPMFSGFHMVLNIWASMLGLPLNDEFSTSEPAVRAEFLRLGTDIVNLALAGRMDTETMAGYLIHFGYCQRPRTPFPQLPLVRMHNEKLSEILTEQVARDAADDIAERTDDPTQDEQTRITEYALNFQIDHRRVYDAWLLGGEDRTIDPTNVEARIGRGIDRRQGSRESTATPSPPIQQGIWLQKLMAESGPDEPDH